MTDLRRAAALAGPGAALAFCWRGSSGTSPFQASSGELIDHYSRNAVNSDISALFNMLTALLVIVFAVGLWLRLCDAPSAGVRGWSLVGLTGAGSFAVVSMVAAAAGITLAGLAGVDQPAGDAVRAAAVALNATQQVQSLAAVPMLAGFGLAGLAFSAHARWLAWAALAAAVAGVIGVLPNVVASFSVMAADLLGLIGQVETPLLLIWLIGVSFSSGGPAGEDQEEG